MFCLRVSHRAGYSRQPPLSLRLVLTPLAFNAFFFWPCGRFRCCLWTCFLRSLRCQLPFSWNKICSGQRDPGHRFLRLFPPFVVTRSYQNGTPAAVAWDSVVAPVLLPIPPFTRLFPMPPLTPLFFQSPTARPVKTVCSPLLIHSL